MKDKPPTREQALRWRILEQYVSLRQFAAAADVPYSTLLTLLERGVGGAAFDTVLRICRTLSMDPFEI
ncbi:MAG: hypothetical protein IJ412_00975 [Oscillospiraceae bacterium]|nr:hypothetical protein [Oscillospiraceae bacterium]